MKDGRIYLIHRELEVRSHITSAEITESKFVVRTSVLRH